MVSLMFLDAGTVQRHSSTHKHCISLVYWGRQKCICFSASMKHTERDQSQTTTPIQVILSKKMASYG